ncbi:MAG: class I SAM-dependent methyltransferase [Chloroflexi bacterium]|nr:MAG: class I SAM-dependent methyltransferase [Chloroflexota bacterium]
MLQMRRTNPSLTEDYDYYPRIEAEFQSALDQSLNPRGPELLYEIVGDLGLPAKTDALDLGCGEGRFALELAKRFTFRVTGIDPVPRNIEVSNQQLRDATKRDPQLADLLRFELGAVETLALAESSIDLIWCREVLALVEDLASAFVECRRVLRAQGRMLIYQNCRTARLEPREAELLGATGRFDAREMEGAFEAAGFEAEQFMDLGSEIGEHIEEQTGEASRRLRHAARLLRDPQRYIAQFGQTAYDIMLGDCLWHVYRRIGKLSGRLYLLKTS